MDFIGKHLRILRKQKSLSLNDVHKSCSIDKSALSRYELCKLYPSESDLKKLSKLYDASFKHLAFHCTIDRACKKLVEDGFDRSNIKDYIVAMENLLEQHIKKSNIKK